MSKAVAYLFIFFCFFPYLDVLRIGTDTQPNALFVGTVSFFLCRSYIINKKILCLWLLPIVAILLIFTSKLSLFDSVKTILNYVSLAAIPTFTYAIFKRYSTNILSKKLFLVFTMVWFIIGFIQLFIYPEFLTFLLNGGGRGVGIMGRGVVSIASEPAFYGSTILLFIVFYLVHFNERNIFILGMLLLQILLFAKSTTGLALLALSGAVFFLVKILLLKLKYIIYAALVISALSFSYSIAKQYADGSRIIKLTVKAVENPELFAILDSSVTVRFVGSSFPFLSLYYNKLKPNGYGTFPDFLKKLRANQLYRDLLTSDVLNSIKRIGGGINMTIYHFGIIGFIFPLILILLFYPYFKNDNYLFGFILFFIVLISQIQLMNAMIGMIIGCLPFKKI